jgi:hypothetical protein
MIIEKIFPVNYYNELSGLMTDSSIAQILLKKNFQQIYDLLEPSGGIIYLNNTINKWLLTIFIHRISEIYSNLIWDLFLLEGNIVLFKALYGMMTILEPYIITKCKTFDELNQLLNNGLLIKQNREKLAYYLIGKKYNFNMDMIKQYRKKINKDTIKEIIGIGDFHRDGKILKKKNGNEIICDLKNPLCVLNQKNLNETYDKIILKQLNKPEIIEDYAMNYEKYKKNKESEEENFEDLVIERRKHLCNFQEKSYTNINKINEELIKIDIDGKNNDKMENNNMIEIDNSYDDINNSENIKINKIVSDLAKNYEKNINVKKENEEDKIMADD